MVGMTALWLPILLSAVLVFVASSIIHMVLRYHRSDYAGLPGEDNILEAMRKEGVRPGSYFFPWCASQAEMSSPEMTKKFERGPVGFMGVIPSRPIAMAKKLIQWFIYILVVGVLVAYLTGRTLGPDAEYLSVFRVAGTTAFLAYAGAQPIFSIWKAQPWGMTLKDIFDGLIYALLTAGTFGWLWPS